VGKFSSYPTKGEKTVEVQDGVAIYTLVFMALILAAVGGWVVFYPLVFAALILAAAGTDRLEEVFPNMSKNLPWLFPPASTC